MGLLGLTKMYPKPMPKFKSSVIAAATLIAVMPTRTYAVDFDAAIGRTGFGRCHMDNWDFFTIDAEVPVGSNKTGTLFSISARSWSAEYRMYGENDIHEYDRAPVKVGNKVAEISMVFCSKTVPVLFNYSEGKWHSIDLRPGDESAVFGYNEYAYQFYYAACHHFITRDPVSKAMALKLGYRFAEHPSDSNISDNDDKRQPLDMLQR